MGLFYLFSAFLSEIIFFYFMRFTVIARIFGLVVMVGNISYYGSDLCIFYRYKLIINC